MQLLALTVQVVPVSLTTSSGSLFSTMCRMNKRKRMQKYASHIKKKSLTHVLNLVLFIVAPDAHEKVIHRSVISLINRLIRVPL